MDVLEKLGSIAGIAGILSGVFLLIFRDVIRKSIFPNLSKLQGYKIIRLILYLTWSLAILGLAAWIYFGKRSEHLQETNDKEFEPLDRIEYSVPEDSLMSDTKKVTTYSNKIKTFIILFIFLSGTNGFSQKKVSKTPYTLTIVNSLLRVDKQDYPILYLTFQNPSVKSMILNKVRLDVVNFKPSDAKSIPESKELRPLASWDLELPLTEGAFIYQTRYPLEIATKESGTIRIRFHCLTFGERNSLPQDCGTFTFRLVFLSSTNQQTRTGVYVIGAN